MDTKTKSNGNVVAIVAMFFLFAMISFVTNLASPMGDILKSQFSIPNWQGTLGVFANFIAYAIMGLPAGNLLQKMGYKKTALIAIAVGFIGVAIQTCSGVVGSFGVYLLGAFIAGCSMCLLNTVVNPMLNSLGGGGNKGNQLIQLGGSFNSLAGTIVIILTGILIPSIAKAQISDVFPLMYAALAIFAFAFVVILLSNIPEKEKEEVKKEDSQYGPMSFRHFMLGAFGIFIYVGVEVGIPNVLQKWLQNPDLNVLGLEAGAEAVAASVAATYWLLMLVGRLLGAAVGSKVSAKAMLTTASLVGIVLTLGAIFADTTNMVNMPVFKNSPDGLFGLVNVPVNAMLLVLVGLCTSVMWGGIFNLAVEGLGKYTEKASGIFMALVCGGGVLPLLQNAVVDMQSGIGYQVSYWVVVAGLAYLLYYALLGSKNVNKDIPVK
ncbi:MAG: MFS transporter [Muribaculaceae bacterium]|mgnify:FL=1|jgi:FHS family L-fucose permease-like MFS transporter|nr:MFS transporter [Muribaculaceae bacterium]MEE1338209.1 MFS transporter [Muribaculaceae bacterium]